MKFVLWLNSQRERFENALATHAAKYGIQSIEVELAGVPLSFAWMIARDEDSRRVDVNASGDGEWILPINPSDSAGNVAGTAETNVSTSEASDCPVLRISRAGVVTCTVPPLSVDQVFYDTENSVVTNDFRLLFGLHAFEPDEAGIYSLFEFGTSVPPRTIHRRVRRISPGTEVTWQKGERVITRPFVRPAEAGETKGESADVLATCAAVLPPPSSTPAHLLFSGGIDSTLLAIALKEAGHSDIHLYNCAIRAEDAEAEHASAVAKSMGLPITRFTFEKDFAADFFGDVAQDYSFPFGDFSCLPTNFLMREACKAMRAGTLVDGTGADGLFGITEVYEKWKKPYRIPRVARQLAGSIYRAAGLWRRNSSRAENLLRAVSVTARRPSFLAFLNQQALHRIAYTVPDEVNDEINRLAKTEVYDLFEFGDERDSFSYMDLVFACCGAFAAKNFDVGYRRGVRICYPFLTHQMFAAAVGTSWAARCKGSSKGMLKSIVAEHVPRELVYRKKSGFMPPVREILASESLRDVFHDVVFAADNELLRFANRSRLEQMFRSVQGGAEVSSGTYQFLVTLAFASCWLDGVRG